jgi:hypothetical protein
MQRASKASTSSRNLNNQSPSATVRITDASSITNTAAKEFRSKRVRALKAGAIFQKPRLIIASRESAKKSHEAHYRKGDGEARVSIIWANMIDALKLRSSSTTNQRSELTDSSTSDTVHEENYERRRQCCCITLFFLPHLVDR